MRILLNKFLRWFLWCSKFETPNTLISINLAIRFFSFLNEEGHLLYCSYHLLLLLRYCCSVIYSVLDLCFLGFCSLIVLLAALPIQGYGACGYIKNTHLRYWWWGLQPSQKWHDVSAELIEAGRFRWWDAQLKKPTRSRREDETISLYWRDNMGLYMQENNSGVPPHMHGEASWLILT